MCLSVSPLLLNYRVPRERGIHFEAFFGSTEVIPSSMFAESQTWKSLNLPTTGHLTHEERRALPALDVIQTNGLFVNTRQYVGLQHLNTNR